MPNTNDDVQGIELTLDSDARISVSRYETYTRVTIGAICHRMRDEEVAELFEELADSFPELVEKWQEVSA
jgi:hypothetical protein